MIVNLTPHTLNIADRDGNVIVVIPPSGTVARIAVTRRQCGVTEEGIPLFVPSSLPSRASRRGCLSLDRTRFTSCLACSSATFPALTCTSLAN